jgi:hypothetical protein
MDDIETCLSCPLPECNDRDPDCPWAASLGRAQPRARAWLSRALFQRLQETSYLTVEVPDTYASKLLRLRLQHQAWRHGCHLTACTRHYVQASVLTLRLACGERVANV